MGASSEMVASCLEKRASCACSLTMMRNFSFFMSSACATICSMEPNWAISFLAVFSPTPRMPGMLSEASPQRPRRSITWRGSLTSNFSLTSSTPMRVSGLPMRPKRYILTVGVTSWAKSLSGVTMTTWSNPASSALWLRVPITSSASKPSQVRMGMRKASIIFFTHGRPI